MLRWEETEKSFSSGRFPAVGSDAQQWQQRQAFSTERKCSLSLEGVPGSGAARVLSLSDRGRRQTSSPPLNLSLLACGCRRVLGSLGLLSSGTLGWDLVYSPSTPRHFPQMPSALGNCLPTCAPSQQSEVNHHGRWSHCLGQLLLRAFTWWLAGLV